jgi:hypothetical protein
MEVAIAKVKGKIMEMYPEIERYGIACSMIFDNEKKTYVFKLTHGPHELATYIDQADADACLEGKECIHLGIQVRQFLENFKEGEK